MAVFRAFKPEAMNKIAKSMGYTGDMGQFQDFIEQDPARQARMQQFTNAAIQMAKGGLVKMQAGGVVNMDAGPITNTMLPRPVEGGTIMPTASMPLIQRPLDDDPKKKKPKKPKTPKNPNIQQATMQRMYNPALPIGGAVTAAGIPLAFGTDMQQGVGELEGQISVGTQQAGFASAADPRAVRTSLMDADKSRGDVEGAIRATEAAQGTVDPRAQVTAAQQTKTSVGDVTEAQGNAILIDNPVQRELQEGELISGAAADATKAAQFTEQIQAAEATPSKKATVQGQLEGLMQQFEGGNTPSWAAGAMRSATQAMAARGLGSSSIAGQAIIQAAMESALPIAQADANVTAQFEAQNLSNRQQRAVLAAQQRAQFLGQEFDQAFQARVTNAARVSDIANQNFTAEQQITLENSRIANSMNLTNLNNSQAKVMAEAAALANLDVANLNNRQQQAVQNAQNFMQMDLTNLSNKQSTEMFKAQQRFQSIFTDQAAENARRQFNATSRQQVDQFMSNMFSQTQQFNASQRNAQEQFNAGQRNTVERFNAELNNQRDTFNAQNQLAIAQSNVQWRREIATANTAAVNRANELNATNVLDISKQAYDNLWQYFGDTMEWAWTSAENAQERNSAMAIAELDAKARKAIANENAKGAAGSAIGGLIGSLGSAWITKCWVAREVYGSQNAEWYVFRVWLQYDAPEWLNKLYTKHGQDFAKFISNKPMLKWITKQLMDFVVDKKRKRHNVQRV